MRARAALFKHLQTLFETELRGVLPYGELSIYVERPVEKEPGKRRLAFGKVREIVEGEVGGFKFTIESPYEVPPLGRATLHRGDDELVTGPIDATTFARMGEAVRNHVQQQRDVPA